MNEKQLEIINNLKEQVKFIDGKDFNVYFYVLDTKNTPTGSMSYLYETALTLKEMRYNVTMLHNDNEFIGVREWMGDVYADIPHANIENENVEIRPCDFLFVPEIFSNVLAQTKKLPCKRVVILQNFNYLTEFMPFGGGWSDMGIRDVITTTERQSQLAKECFPYINTYIVPPAIKSMYYEGKEPKKMVINIVAKNQSDVNRIVKPFYWKYPLYRWVSFRDLRGLPNDVFADALREAAITIWVDNDTNFGYTPLEAMKSGSIVIGKIPEEIPEWMMDENNNINNAGIWFDNINDVYPMIASVVRTWVNDEVPSEIFNEMKKMSDKYTPSQQKDAINAVYVEGFFNKRKNDFLDAISKLSTHQNNTNENE
jgi:hypothetical protein